MVSAVANWERQRISERTKEALAAVQARGVKLGRPRVLPDEVRRRIRRERKRGRSYGAIADRLNEDGVPTAHGGQRWWPSTVRAVVGSG
jgi:DNA invertase Pin-like site-specific DNA recombinase